MKETALYFGIVLLSDELSAKFWTHSLRSSSNFIEDIGKVRDIFHIFSWKKRWENDQVLGVYHYKNMYFGVTCNKYMEN